MARALTPRERTEASVRDGFGGDAFRRSFAGDVLVECPVHRAATEANVAKFKRERNG